MDFPPTVRDLAPHAQVERYYQACRNFLRLLFLSRKQRDAELLADEVLQTVAVKLLNQKLSPWKVTGKFRDYLKQVLRHAVTDHIETYCEESLNESTLPEEAKKEHGEEDFTLFFGENLLVIALKGVNTLQKSRDGIAFYPKVQARIDEYLHAVANAAEPDQILERLEFLTTFQPHDTRHEPQERMRHMRAHEALASILMREMWASYGPEATVQRIHDELEVLGLLPFVKPYIPAEEWESLKPKNER